MKAGRDLRGVFKGDLGDDLAGGHGDIIWRGSGTRLFANEDLKEIFRDQGHSLKARFFCG